MSDSKEGDIVSSVSRCTQPAGSANKRWMTVGLATGALDSVCGHRCRRQLQFRGCSAEAQHRKQILGKEQDDSAKKESQWLVLEEKSGQVNQA